MLDVQIVQTMQQTDVYVIGVSRHQQTVTNWAQTVEMLGLPLDDWIKSGDIDLTIGACTVFPMKTGRVLCVGMDHRKQLRNDQMATIFETIGRYMMTRKWRTATLFIDTFMTPMFSPQQLCNSAVENIGHGSYVIPRYQTFSNEADVCIEQLYFVTAQVDTIERAVEKSEWTRRFRLIADEPRNILTSARVCETIETFCAQHHLPVHHFTYDMLATLGFGALCAAYEQDVHVLLVNATLQAQHVVTATMMLGESMMPLFNACLMTAQHDLMGVFVFGTPKSLLPHTVITTMIGKTLEIGQGADAKDIALTDVLAFAATQRAKSITSVDNLHADHLALYGTDALIAFSNQLIVQPTTVHVQTTKPMPARQADVFVAYHETGRTLKRANLYHLFAPVPWCHLELPVDIHQQAMHLDVRFRNLVEEETI